MRREAEAVALKLLLTKCVCSGYCALSVFSCVLTRNALIMGVEEEVGWRTLRPPSGTRLLNKGQLEDYRED